MTDKKEPTNTGNGDPQPAPVDAQPPTAPEPESTPSAAEFTQADLDRIVKERLAREREKYADYKELKAAAAELDQIKEAQLTEQEKLQKELETERQARQQAEAIAKQRSIRSALIAEAAKLNFNDPNDAVALINADQLEIDDGGEIKNAAELVKQLADQRKYLVKQGRSLEPFDPTGGQPIRETDAQRRARIYGGGGDWFNPDTAGQAGGGVIWPKGTPEAEE
jgi:hypothetical protein